MKTNVDIRRKAKNAKVKLWQIAVELDLTDTEFSKKLRYELPKKEKERIFNYIERLKKEEM